MTFACINAVAATDDGGGGGKKADDAGDADAAAAAAAACPEGATSRLATYALRIKSPELLEQFLAAANTHKAGGARKAGGGA